ncbi:short-chain dehydrogenase [Sphaerisporangium rufum]|uniref:Short-chain dehydrogenase n=1 Tax=Sphaerisporangium rufum TaxID=1381558 RepID=A0A919R2G4_9ACTN|nr:short-chain dehydrogenase [Sphaerisporangium rufum]
MLVTGANSGIGFETARVLAARGATVVLAGRDQARLSTAVTRLRDAAPDAKAAPLTLDLASLASVRAAAAEFHHRWDRLDLLINNAGLMIPPYGRTSDGFESQFGVNHLGHFALTGLLLDRLLGTPGSRIVTVSSNGHRRGTIDFDDLHAERRYRPMAAYAQSKLANLLFTYELQDRLAANRATTIAVAAHPGAARTRLMRHSPWHFRFVVSGHTRMLFSWLIQDEEAGALPTLRAATDPATRGGEYYGPDGWKEFTGRHPVPVSSSPRSHDTGLRRRLWQESERLTGVHYEFAPVTGDALAES